MKLEEGTGKLFPTANRSSAVLDALLDTDAPALLFNPAMRESCRSTWVLSQPGQVTSSSLVKLTINSNLSPQSSQTKVKSGIV
mgnify:CR=1 FL=1